MMTPMNARTIDEARKEAIQYSGIHNNMYFIIVSEFGMFLVGKDKLWKEAPGDAFYNCKFYYHNGREKEFTEKQLIKNQPKWRD